MIGREMTQQFPERKSCVDKNKVLLECQNLYGNGDKDISFKIYRGEVLGLGGLIGTGRTELAQLLFGYATIESGKIIMNGREIQPKHPKEAIEMGIALVPEDRKRHGVLLENSILHNINMSVYNRISIASVIKSKEEREIGERYREKLQIKTPALQQLAKNLSGGNQQKVVLAKWLAADSELIIFDEPTRGIDVGAKFEIYKLINDLAAQGKSILMISSEMEELIGMSDRIIVFSENRIAGEIEKKDFSADLIMSYASSIPEKGDL